MTTERETFAGTTLVDNAPIWVRLNEVGFTYPNGTRAIVDTTIDVPEGAIVGIVGPSGCGKSSLLSLVSGITEPTAGEITFSDDPHRDGARHSMSMVFQKDTLLPWLTVEQNVRMFQRYNRVDNRRFSTLVTELLELGGLTAFADAYPYQLSGGMRRRVAFLTAMAAQPRGLLLDEPFSALDEPTRIAIHQDVLNIVRRAGTSVLLVTHDLSEAASLCDQVIIMSSHPGTVAARFDVPFGPQRDVLNLRQEPEFQKLVGALWAELSRQIDQVRADKEAAL